MRTRSTFKRNSLIAVLVVVATTSSFARAQEATEVPKANEATQAVESTEVRDGSTRSPAGAVWMSVGSTVVPIVVGGGMLAAHSGAAQIAGAVLLSTGLVFGPSVGEFYSERWGKGLLFALGRAAAEGMVVGGLAMALSSLCFDNCDNHSDNSGGGIALMAIGGIAETVLIIWGIVDSYNSAEQYNEEHAKKSISLSPFVMPSARRNGENGTAYGLAIAVNF